jgi:hypothetical protein
VTKISKFTKTSQNFYKGDNIYADNGKQYFIKKDINTKTKIRSPLINNNNDISDYIDSPEIDKGKLKTMSKDD